MSSQPCLRLSRDRRLYLPDVSEQTDGEPETVPRRRQIRDRGTRGSAVICGHLVAREDARYKSITSGLDQVTSLLENMLLANELIDHDDDDQSEGSRDKNGPEAVGGDVPPSRDEHTAEGDCEGNSAPSREFLVVVV